MAVGPNTLNSSYSALSTISFRSVLYYVQVRGQESGPFSVDQIKGFLLSVQIGSKTPCRSEDDPRFRPVQFVLPEVVSEVENLREANTTPRLVQEETKRKQVSKILVTTETFSLGLSIDDRIGIVTAEVVFGVNAFREIFAGVRNFVSGRSDTLQKVLRDAREVVLGEMRREASQRNADAIIGVSLNYNDITTGGSTMLFLVGVGTAVRLASDNSTDDLDTTVSRQGGETD